MRKTDKASVAPDAVSAPDSADPIKDLARLILSKNRKRKLFLPDIDWGEPSWYILLDLFIAETEDLDTCAAAIAHRNNIPLSTTSRYLALMVERGLLQAAPAEISAGAADMRLTKKAKRGLVSWIRDVMAAMGPEF